jgi:hypothetical protein
MASLTAGTCDGTSFRTFLVCGKLVPSCRQAFVVNLSRLERTCPGFIEEELASGTSWDEFRQKVLVPLERSH